MSQRSKKSKKRGAEPEQEDNRQKLVVQEPQQAPQEAPEMEYTRQWAAQQPQWPAAPEDQSKQKQEAFRKTKAKSELTRSIRPLRATKTGKASHAQRAMEPYTRTRRRSTGERHTEVFDHRFPDGIEGLPIDPGDMNMLDMAHSMQQPAELDASGLNEDVNQEWPRRSRRLSNPTRMDYEYAKKLDRMAMWETDQMQYLYHNAQRHNETEILSKKRERRASQRRKDEHESRRDEATKGRDLSSLQRVPYA